MLIFDNVLCIHLDNGILLLYQFYIDFNKLQAPVWGCTKILGGECYNHRNWTPKLNLVGHVSMYGDKLGTSVDVQVSQHDSTVHAQKLFPPKWKDRWLWCHYHAITVTLITNLHSSIKRLPHKPQRSVLVRVLKGKATNSLSQLSWFPMLSRTIKHTGKCLLFVYLRWVCPRFTWMS